MPSTHTMMTDKPLSSLPTSTVEDTRETRRDAMQVVWSNVGYRLPLQTQGNFVSRGFRGVLRWGRECFSSGGGGRKVDEVSGSEEVDVESGKSGSGGGVSSSEDDGKGFEEGGGGGGGGGGGVVGGSLLKGKEVLKGVSGCVLPGELLAILGPSGSGKTTFLNLLSGRSEYGLSEGCIRFNGKKREGRMRRVIAYVMQDDVFLNKLTVFQTLYYTALMRLPGKMSNKEKESVVEGIMKRLLLDKARDTRIGDQSFHKGISGGERKRVNIANELLTDPALVMLDEPTSGLDSTTALTVVRLLRELADEGRSVIATLHQPSSKMFQMFDRLMLLSGGRVVYFGRADMAVDYFASIGFHVPPGFSPSDYFMDLLIEGASDDDQGDLDLQATLVSSWEQRKHEYLPVSVMENALRTDPDSGKKRNIGKGLVRAAKKRTKDVVGKGGAVEEHPKYPSSWFTQARALASRSLLQKGGELVEFIQLSLTTIVAALCGIFWFQLPQNEETLEERVGLLFFINVYLAFSQMFNALFSFPREKAVLHKDRSGGSYRLSAYFFARTTVDIPFDSIYPLLFSIISYWLTGLNPSFGRFLIFMIVITLVALVASSIGLFIASSVMDMRKGQVIASVAVLASMLVGGFYVKSENLPSWVLWMQKVSFLRYPYVALIRNETAGREYDCSENSPTIYRQNRPENCPITSEDILKGTQLTDSLSIANNCLIMVAWIVGFRLLAYFSLKYFHRSHKQRARKS